jgi:hypothetical protein
MLTRSIKAPPCRMQPYCAGTHLARVVSFELHGCRDTWQILGAAEALAYAFLRVRRHRSQSDAGPGSINNNAIITAQERLATYCAFAFLMDDCGLIWIEGGVEFYRSGTAAEAGAQQSSCHKQRDRRLATHLPVFPLGKPLP